MGKENKITEYLEQTRNFIDKLTEDDIKKFRSYLPDELYELVFKLVPRSAVDVIIVDDKNTSVVLVTRGVGDNLGKWNIPGGWIKHGERLENAVKRKAKQETGLDVEIDKKLLRNGLIGVYDDPNIDEIGWTRGKGFQIFNPKAFTHTLCITFLTRRIGGNLIKNKKVEARFFKFKELPNIIPYNHKQVIANVAKLLKKK